MSWRLSALEIVAMGMALSGAACSSQAGGAEGAAGEATSPVCASFPVADAPYRTVAELDALVVGRWARCHGPPQLEHEELGIEFGEGRVISPLRRAPGDAVEPVPPPPGVGPESWSALLDGSGHPRLVFMWASAPSKTRSSFVIEGPSFFDGGRQMFLPYAEVGATYARFEP